ncbi:hypothetical protein AB2J22_13210 [Aeromonas sp. A5]|uniref:hypothetical protein n=1 Tax=unclassified Aeromonas TaxID=257493 RepID=UPI0037703E56
MALTDWKEIFINLVKIVTLDEAALVAASINPVEVGGLVDNAKLGEFDNWQKAVLVARLLRDAVASDNIQALEAHVDTLHGCCNLMDYSSLCRHMKKNPSHRIERAKFRASEVWIWLARKKLIEPECVAFHIYLHNAVIKKINAELENRQAARLITSNEQSTPLKPFATTDGSRPGYLNPSHPRYSHKLAAAIAVWEAMENEKLLQGVSTKTAMTNWLRANQKANGFELSKTGINEVVIVANWSTKGGAPKTPSPT